eukprot:c20616_g1_i1 orf=295-561(-)
MHCYCISTCTLVLLLCKFLVWGMGQWLPFCIVELQYDSLFLHEFDFFNYYLHISFVGVLMKYWQITRQRFYEEISGIDDVHKPFWQVC